MLFLRQPITNPKNRARFRGPLVSAAFNQNLEDIFYDLYQLYRETEEEKEVLRAATSFLADELAALMSFVSSLNKNPLVCTPASMTAAYPRQDQDAADTSPRAHIDRDFGVVTLPLASPPVPKTYFYDAQRNESFVSRHLEVEVSASAAVVEQNEPKNIVAPDSSFWYQRVYFPSDAAPAVHQITVEVSLPYQVLTDLKFNSITFRAHPTFTLAINNLEYEYRGVWRPIPGFSAVQRASAHRWCFPTIEARRLRLVLEQPYPLSEGPHKVFVFGGRQLAAYREEYLDRGIVLSPFVVSPPATVKRIKHRFANAACLSQPAPEYDRPMPWFDFELYKEEPDGTLSYLPSWSNLPYGKLWVKTILKKDPPTGATPALAAVELEVA